MTTAVAETFDFTAYWANLRQQLAQLQPLPEGVRDPLDLPEVRRRLTLHDPLLFAVLYLPELFLIDGELVIDAQDRDLAGLAVSHWTVDPPLVRNHDGVPHMFDTSARPAWQSVLPIWSAAHGHLDYLVAMFLTGATDPKVLDPGMRSTLVRADFPLLWHERKTTKRGRAEWFAKKRRRL